MRLHVSEFPDRLAVPPPPHRRRRVSEIQRRSDLVQGPVMKVQSWREALTTVVFFDCVGLHGNVEQFHRPVQGIVLLGGGPRLG